MVDLNSIKKVDPELYSCMVEELTRQRDNVELIASENFVSAAVMACQGSYLTNKYAEGYPAKRYYGGCQFVDKAETLAIERAKTLFKAEYANVQAHSGSNANFAAYFALLEHGDTILGMNLAHGGHLTHGSPVNFSGKLYNIVPYGVDEVHNTIDYDALESLALEVKPKMIVAGASAYPRTIDFARFREIADKCGAYFMVDMAHIAGLVATGLHPSPIPYADVVTTTTHKTLRGPRGGMILSRDPDIGVKINKSIFPGIQGGPLMHVIAAKAVALKEAMSDEFVTYQKQVVANAASMADEFIKLGVKLVSGGTDNHLMLLDLKERDITGKELEHLLDQCHITVNKNAVPFDPRKPFVTSGIRIGTPSITTRGMKEQESRLIARLITKIIEGKEQALEQVDSEIVKLTKRFPLYENDIL